MNEEKTLFVATVCFPIRGNEILLAKKKMKIGKDCWNGYGGGVEEGETLTETAVRELKEESGIETFEDGLIKIAVMDFYNQKTDGSVFTARVHFYTVSEWEGECHESIEMAEPTWFPINEIPFHEMMPADRIFLPLAFSGKKIVGSAHYSPFQKMLIGDVEIQEVSEFPVE